jgi:hypothetical protein
VAWASRHALLSRSSGASISLREFGGSALFQPTKVYLVKHVLYFLPLQKEKKIAKLIYPYFQNYGFALVILKRSSYRRAVSALAAACGQCTAGVQWLGASGRRSGARSRLPVLGLGQPAGPAWAFGIFSSILPPLSPMVDLALDPAGLTLKGCVILLCQCYL